MNERINDWWPVLRNCGWHRSMRTTDGQVRYDNDDAGFWLEARPGSPVLYAEGGDVCFATIRTVDDLQRLHVLCEIPGFKAVEVTQ